MAWGMGLVNVLMVMLMLTASLVGSWTAVVSAAPPIVSTPELLPGDTKSEIAHGMQLNPSLATGGGMVLAAWADARSSVAHGGLDDQTGEDIYAARLGALGETLDKTPIVVRQAFGYQRSPQVAFNGTHWLVVWENQGATAGYYGFELQAARIALDGTVLDSTPVSVHSFANSMSGMFAVTAVNGQWVVVTSGTSAGESSIYARRVSADGVLIDKKAVEIVPSTYYLYFNLGLTNANGEILVSWLGSSTMMARRFSSGLVPLAPAFTIPGNQVASSGSSYLVGWINNGIRATPMSAQGVVQYPSGKVIATAVPTTNGGFRLTWDGTNWWMAFASVTGGIEAMALDTAATPVPGSTVTLTSEAAGKLGAIAIAGVTPGQLVGAWEGRPITPNDTSIWARSASITGGIGEVSAVSQGAAAQLFSDVALAPFQRMIVWLESTGMGHQVMAQRFSLLGYPLDPQPTVIDTGVGLFGDVRAAYDGQRWMVAWVKDNKLYTRRVSPDGFVLDATPNFVANAYNADVAGGGGQFYLVYNMYISYPQQVFVFGVKADGTTGAVIPNSAINLGGSYALAPRVERWNNQWVATWQSHFSHDNPQAATVFGILDQDGTLVTSAGTGYGGQVRFAPGDTTGLVVWRANSLANANNDVHCAAISPAGVIVGGPTVVSAAPYRQLRPTATWTGTEFLMVWEDQRDAMTFFDYRSTLYGARIGSDGTLLDTTGFAVAPGPLPVVDPQLAADSGYAVLTASFFMPEEPYASYRLGIVSIGKVPVAGDLNLDGNVNQTDVKLQRTCYGKSLNQKPQCAMGDLDQNGLIDTVDWVGIRKLAGGK